MVLPMLTLTYCLVIPSTYAPLHAHNNIIVWLFHLHTLLSMLKLTYCLVIPPTRASSYAHTIALFGYFIYTHFFPCLHQYIVWLFHLHTLLPMLTLTYCLVISFRHASFNAISYCLVISSTYASSHGHTNLLFGYSFYTRFFPCLH